MSKWGAFDMAGNAKEWCSNSGGSERRYVLGGAWREAPYMFAQRDAQPAFDRAATYGFRCLRVSGIQQGANLGIYGFGADGHVCLQVARHWGANVFVCTREEKHRGLATELGAVWTGGAMAEPPVEAAAEA